MVPYKSSYSPFPTPSSPLQTRKLTPRTQSCRNRSYGLSAQAGRTLHSKVAYDALIVYGTYVLLRQQGVKPVEGRIIL